MSYAIKDISEITEIKTIEDVKEFLTSIISGELGMAFHPDDDFNSYTWESDGSQVFEPEEAGRLNNLMSDAFKVCEENGADLYDLTLKTIQRIYQR